MNYQISQVIPFDDTLLISSVPYGYKISDYVLLKNLKFTYSKKPKPSVYIYFLSVRCSWYTPCNENIIAVGINLL
jgi:hypothetical protein